jgi:hypothetical protein
MGAAGRQQHNRTALLFCILLIAVPNRARAQQETLWFLGGATLALGMHEAGHVVMDEVFGASPGLKKVSFGPFPFFAITHDTVSNAREVTISSAGFWVQHATNEIILSRSPYIHDSSAPLVKGMFAFNVLSSIAYSGAAFARAGPSERDTRGMAVGADVPEPAVGVLILAPAALDIARYYKPDVAWTKWTSRAAKLGALFLVLKARS